MRLATATHRVEYLALSAILIGVAIWQRESLGWEFWLFLLAPDLFGLLPAFLFGRPPARGHLPPRGVWLYNVWHTFTIPMLAWVAVVTVLARNPWPLLGWLLHISADRAIGYGLRGDDGGQAVF